LHTLWINECHGIYHFKVMDSITEVWV